MNKAILRFRFRQLWKIIREIPIVYLLLLLIFTGIFIVVIYRLATTATGTISISIFLLLGLYALHIKRRDYRFICLIEEKPWRIFCIEYLLLSLFFIVIVILQGYYWMGIAIISGCMAIPFVKQQISRISSGLTPPSFITYDAFELRAGFRQYGILLIILYIVSWGGLFFPYVSLGALWLFTLIWMDFFRTSEPLHILCAKELPSGQFLHSKIRLYIRLYVIAILPVYIIYSILYTDTAWYAMLFFLYALLNIILIIVTKYAYYIPQSKIVAGNIAITFSLFGMLLPLLLPLTLFYLTKNYLAARRNLIPYLDAYNTESSRTIQ